MDDFGDFFDRKFDPFDRKRQEKERRVLLKSKKNIKSELYKGIVFATTGKDFFVESENIPDEFIECVYGATLQSKHLNSSIISVGDNVEFIYTQKDSKSNTPKGKIVSVDDRQTHLSRKAIGIENAQVIASNMDYLVICCSIDEPSYNKRLIDRMIVAAETGGMTPVLCINKCDLMNTDIFHEDLKIYSDIGLEKFFISAKSGLNFAEFASFISGKKSVFCGQSGVGKSSIINSLIGSDEQLVNLVSKRTNKGQHTTSYSRMFRIDRVSLIIDTPGIREFALWDISKEELPFFFHEFDEYFRECKYLPCSHTHEPFCKVIESVENGTIDADRYQSYLNILESIS